MGRIITLTTDFGNRDPFVGIMKGVILSICPEARIVDLTHEIKPFDILGGALALSSAYRFFPKGTIHLVVVDPGVGTKRKAIAVRAGGHYFVGPDNGVLSLAIQTSSQQTVDSRQEEKPNVQAVEIKNPKVMLKEVSSTFHGRDVFAPAAAHLAKGVPLNELGPRLGNMKQLVLPAVRHIRRGIEGEVIAFDRFGNAITNLRGQDSVVSSQGKGLVLVGDKPMKLVKSYGGVTSGEALALWGSHGFLEIAVNQGSAQEALGLVKGTKVSLRERLK